MRNILHSSFLVVVGLLAVGVGIVGAQEAAPLSLTEVLRLPLVRPDVVTTSEGFSDGSVDVEAGTELAVRDVQRDGVVVALPKSGELIMIPAEWTDLGARAARIQAELPEDVRALTAQDLVKRVDLLPDLAALTSDVELADGRTLVAGTEVVPGRLQIDKGALGVVLLEKDAGFNSYGGVDRLVFNIEFTDLLKRMAERAHKAPDERKLRDSADLRLRLVGADGAPATDRAVPARYYVVYYAADWCGFCTKYTPTVLRAYEAMKEKHPEVEFVYLSSDRSADEMAQAIAKAGYPWPVVAFERRAELRGLLAMAGPGTPHLMVLEADGRLVHDGQPVGASGANAALAALRRQLARPQSN
jgi:thiol-disulfide isomerase/thioredoxin